mgnify:CR=1 FL=1
MAGLDTMNLDHEINKIMAINELVPAVGQGVIAVQTKKDAEINFLMEQINHLETYQCAMAERQMLKVIDGDCDTAIGSITNVCGTLLTISAWNYENNSLIFGTSNTARITISGSGTISTNNNNNEETTKSLSATGSKNFPSFETCFIFLAK